MTGRGQANPRSSRLRIGDRNRRRILDAAIEVFALRGYDGARIAEIAERSRLPKANVYYYFRTKTRHLRNDRRKPCRGMGRGARPPRRRARSRRSAFRLHPRQARIFPQTRGAVETVRQRGRARRPLPVARGSPAHACGNRREGESVRDVDKGGTDGSRRPRPPVHPSLGSDPILRRLRRDGEERPRRRAPDPRAFREAAEETIAQIVLSGCGIRLRARRPGQRRPPAKGDQGNLPSRSVSKA